MSFRPTNAFVLAAGLGTRMRPLTEKRPKPLVTLAGRSLIDHALDRLQNAGIQHAVVNVHYKADMLEAALLRRKRGPAIVISDERRKLLDTGGGIAHALPLLGSTPFVVFNSDCVWIDGIAQNLERLFDMWDDTRMDCLMLLALGASSIGYDGRGDFLMDSSGRVSRRPSKSEAPFVFTGVSIVHPRLFEGAPDGSFSLNLLWDRAIAKGRVYGMRMDGIWMHVGTPESLQDAERLIAGDDWL